MSHNITLVSQLAILNQHLQAVCHSVPCVVHNIRCRADRRALCRTSLHVNSRYWCVCNFVAININS